MWNHTLETNLSKHCKETFSSHGWLQPKPSTPQVHLNLCCLHPPQLHHAPNNQPTLLVYNQSCWAKQSESTGKSEGAGAQPPLIALLPPMPPPFSTVRGPVCAPKAQITSHIMRGLAQQAVPLCLLSLSGWPAVVLLLKSCSVLLCSSLWLPHSQLPAQLLYMSVCGRQTPMHMYVCVHVRFCEFLGSLK